MKSRRSACFAQHSLLSLQTMCGIAGEIRFDSKSVSKRELLAAQKVLKPRGPDSEGLLYNDWSAFVHTRLSIIDLSEGGAQPMQLNDVGLDITYNGEIYNYQEIKEELKTKGHSFQSTSDTEVLGKAYHEWGLDFVKRLHGMFAFVIYNRRENCHVIGRDRLGIKPLYYAKTDKHFCFVLGFIRDEMHPVAVVQRLQIEQFLARVQT